MNIRCYTNVVDKQDIRIGTSGFSYKDWLGNFYPQFCPQADFLTFYCSKLKTVEIDSTFYRMPSEKTVAHWARASCRKFIFAAKFPSVVTHEGELSQRIDNALEFINLMKGLDSKLGPLLLQFPYSFKPDQKSLLFSLVEALPVDVRLSVELRHRGWLEVDELFDLLKEKNISFCLIDHPCMPRKNIVTADFVYIRFLGDRKAIDNDFSFVRFDKREELDWWTELITEHALHGREIYAYFNNHYSGHAPSTALDLIDRIKSGQI